MTDETKYTPGPWEYVAGNEHHGPYVASYSGDVADCYTMSNPMSASIRNGGDSYPILFQAEEAEANAKLIAAAPEMLEALREIAKHWPDSSAAKTARAAIAKAEGHSK